MKKEKQELKLPVFKLYSTDDFDNWRNNKYTDFDYALRKYQVSTKSNRTKTWEKVDRLTFTLSVLSSAAFLFLGGAWFLTWIPVSLSILAGMVIDHVATFSLPKYKLLKKIEERKVQEQEERLKAMQPPTIDIEYLKGQVQEWAKVEPPAFIKDAYTDVLVDLLELLDAIEENDLDLDRWLSLFKRYVPDIVDVVKEYESYDDVNDQALTNLFHEMGGYLKAEIKYAKLGKRVSHSSTIKAYTSYFSGQNGDKTLGGV